MSIICRQCGRTMAGEGMAFCPYCGAKLEEPDTREEPKNEEADQWIRRAMAVSSYPERKKILLKGLEACPDSREIEWELLFIGEEAPKKKARTLDFSIIKCWVLEMYRKPGDFSEEKRNAMREQFFDAPQLIRCLNRFEDPDQKQREYLFRLCRTYIEIFLEGDSQIMGRLFGFSIEKNKERRLAEPAAQIIARMKADEKLSPERREQLWKAFYQAYADRMNGKTEHLNAFLDA